MSIVVLNTFWLWVAAAFALAILLGWGFKITPPRAGLRSPFLLRLLAAVFLSLALAEIKLVRSQQTSKGTVLLDISESMDEGVAQNLLERARSLVGSDTELEIVPFAKTASTELNQSDPRAAFSSIRGAFERLNIGGSNLEAGVSAVLGRGGQNILLISEGQETEGAVERLLPQLVNTGTRVYPITPSDSEESGERFNISKLYAPLIAPAQKSVEVRVSVRNSTSSVERGLLEVRHGEAIVLSRQVEISPGQESVIVAESDPQLEGIQEITATLSPQRANLPRSVERIYLSTEEREKVLLISGSTEDERVLKELLKQQAYQLKSFIAGDDALAAIEMAQHSTVIFNNIARADVPRKILEGVPGFVQSGGGFVMVGGNKSFGLGGYINSAIEQVLPVELVPPQAEKKRVTVGVALVIDKSGSMSQSAKLDYAKEAAEETIRNLKDDDFVTVVGFDDAPFVVIKASRVGDIRYDAAERVGRLFAAGRTNLLPAIDEARRNLARTPAGRRHIIVLTDGRLPDEGPFYIELTKELRMAGFTLSTVLLGSDTDYRFLKDLADVGGGGFYQTNDARNLPRIFLQDLRVSTGERTMKEASEYAVRPGMDDIVSTTIRSFPALKGYVQTKPKRGAGVELVVLADSQADPLLASWRYGKGRAVAFTSDANGRWSYAWTQWSKFFQFWTELIDSTRSEGSGTDAGIKFNLRSTVERGELLITMEIFGERDPGELSAALAGPDGAGRELSFVRFNKGLYEARVRSPLPGRYELSARSSIAAKLTPVAFYLSGELFGERKGLGFNRGLLQRLALESGGAVNPGGEQLKGFAQVNKEQTPLAAIFIVIGMVILTLSVIARELPNLWRRSWRAA
jgi:uncharacterized membrane protein